MNEYRIGCDCGCGNVLVACKNSCPENTVTLDIETTFKRSLWNRIKLAFKFITKTDNLPYGKDNIIIKLADLRKILEE